MHDTSGRIGSAALGWPARTQTAADLATQRGRRLLSNIERRKQRARKRDRDKERNSTVCARKQHVRNSLTEVLLLAGKIISKRSTLFLEMPTVN